MNETDVAFYAQLARQSLVTAQNLHEASLRHLAATTNVQIDNVSNGIYDNTLNAAAVLRASQKPIMPDAVQ